MELKRLFAVLSRRWWLIGLPTLIALALSLPSMAQVVRPQPLYRVTVRFTAAQPPQPGSAETFEERSYIAWLGSEYAVINLAAWLRTESFAREVTALLKAAGREVGVESVRAMIASDSVRSILTLYLTASDPELLRATAEAAIQALTERSNAYFPQLRGQPAQVVPLDSVEVTPLPVPITERLAPLLRVLVGFVGGLGLAALAEYLDPSVRTRQEIEALGLAILAEIPPL
ncbi:MAG: hypothetical protein CUN49_06385 [Candidatus Thermofonsia Clade 1 bacterium]|uniref:Polysaccharide chain length determinant N-terminal domain-containing protein n=1 Tax=Candidatus Thermofonsia Clade 1 bacterium TaxID=2364210 RepID=A0A2M8PFB6_9CHLR|nr:MAG: hypothetical protein CUN49_06385 [Candidatus Thermofonsia Clade 1 bacterium]